tara:strand:+ start:2770 stop:3162 length:393 start_codon:yes stop_codon:yes gene_type:complete
MKSEYQRPIQLELPFDLEATAEAMRQEDAGSVRAHILRTAEEYVTKDRASEHGDIEDNFATIASYWSEHLGTEVTSVDVAVMMALLKLARIKTNAVNRDNWIDGCGYLACGGELVDRKLKSELEGLDRGG